MFNDPLPLMLLKSIHRIAEYWHGQQRTKGTIIPYPFMAVALSILSANAHKPAKASDSQLPTLPTLLLSFLSEAIFS